jgi:light-regulated signal transduction histidine kinase (bacteriophytochrome)
MDADPCMPMAPDADNKIDDLESETNIRDLKTELSERKLAGEELYRLSNALELCLIQRNDEVCALKEQLAQERDRRSKDQEEIGLLNEELSHQKNALEVANKEFESFNYSISHDLRAPIRHLIGFSSMLSEDFRDTLDASAQSFLDSIVKAARKMDLLVEALLKLSRISRQDLKVSIVDLGAIARECADSLMESAPHRKVVFTLADQLSVRADAALLRAAMANLLDNAWKYTGKKEVATIELGRTQSGDATVFYLRDNGAGFDMRYADKLFGPFQRMHRDSEFEGTGMGLATVQRIIHRHGGRIWADAAVDGGATFFFTLAK